VSLHVKSNLDSMSDLCSVLFPAIW